MHNKSLYSRLTLGNKILYHCSTQLQPGSMHSAPADVGDEWYIVWKIKTKTSTFNNAKIFISNIIE
jgi:hypothetical protein